MSFDREASDELEFERKLLASARADAGPRDLANAWARLAGALGPILSDPALGGAGSATANAAAVRATASNLGARLAPAAAMKWMLLGAIAGSAVTTAALYRSRHGMGDVPPAALARAGAPAMAGTMKAAGAARVSVGDAAPAREPADPPAGSGAHSRRSGPGRAHAFKDLEGARATELVPVPSSTLAAEVSRLDTARTSNAVGDYDETVRLVERYHRDFPDGALAPDADVVALEAVAAKRDRTETARRAALFLARYPGDPHAARVKWLAAQ